MFGIARTEETNIHGLRHSFARSWVKNGGSAFALQRILGHQSITMTNRYVKLYAEDIKEDYEDYLQVHHIAQWTSGERYDNLLAYCRTHNDLPDYEQYFERCTDEELANIAITLCHMVDRAMIIHMERKERDFVENRGIRERMTAARLGRRQTQNEEIAALKTQLASLQRENEILKRKLEVLEGNTP
mgnify:CR=1 FL=1